MKTFFRIAAAAALFAAMTACDAFHSLTKSRLKTAQGSPYELIVVCPQQEWTGELGDTLRSILTAPVPYLNQTEPLFDVLRVTERGFSGMVADHRNILKIVEDPSLAATNIAVQYDVTAEPQIVLTLQGPDDKALTDYLSEHRESLVQVLEKAERDRAVKFAEAFSEQRVAKAIKSTFGVDMTDRKAMCWPPTRRISSGRATNTPRPVRASSSIPTPTGARSRSRRAPCSRPATNSPPAFRVRPTVRT